MPVMRAYRARIDAGALTPDPAQERVAARLSALAMDLEGWRPGLKAMVYGRPGPGRRGVYLWGSVGRGKSMLMDLFFDHVAMARKRRVHFHAFMLEIHAAVGEARSARVADPIAKVAKAVAEDAHLLCFDEMQVTDIGDAMLLGRLFENLFGRGVVVVATSNRPPRDLYKDGLNRQLFLPAIDHLEERLDVIELDGGRDFRLDRLRGAPVWLTPAGPETDVALDRAWRRLVDGDEEHPETLRVQGRTLTASRAAAGAARFTFEELCDQPLGAADYLSLAKRFHTLVLDQVPVLTPDRRNAAKRFVTLVDALYETKTNLIASAAAEPDALYPDGDGAFEFARTASRLMEMRSRDYLARPRAA